MHRQTDVHCLLWRGRGGGRRDWRLRGSKNQEDGCHGAEASGVGSRDGCVAWPLVFAFSLFITGHGLNEQSMRIRPPKKDQTGNGPLERRGQV